MSRWDGQRPSSRAQIGHGRPRPVPARMVFVGCAPDGCAMHTNVPAGAFLARFEVDGPDGWPLIEWTTDPAKAIVFPSQRAAMGTWLRTSAAKPQRPDGSPNRPLTHFTVTIEEVPS